MIGKTLLHFEITDKLGEGGMGTIHRTHENRLADKTAPWRSLPARAIVAFSISRFESLVLRLLII